jgi:hypothetical protein
MSPRDGEGGPKPANVEELPHSTNTTSHQSTGCCHSSGGDRYCCSDTVAGLHRRRRASWRMETLACGCGPDPLSCACTQPPLSPRLVDAGRDAARHLLEVGHVPLLEIEVLQALYRRGGRDRALAVELHELCGQEVA